MNGVIVVDKPEGLTSSQVVNTIKKSYSIKKAGHVGTLDPIATGVLPVCINEATKIIPFMDSSLKEYSATMMLGVVTDSMDRTGNILDRRHIGKIKESDILDVLSRFKGNIKQVPPMYSALKKDGVRLYRLARKGIEVEREPRQVFIEELELEEFENPMLRFFARCSGGTYIRALCADIGESLSCGAHLYHLRRLKSSNFDITQATCFDEIKEGRFNLIDMDSALPEMRSLEIDKDLEKIVKNGKRITRSYFNKVNMCNLKAGERIKLKRGKSLVAVVEVAVSSEFFSVHEEEQVFKICRVFN